MLCVLQVVYYVGAQTYPSYVQPVAVQPTYVVQPQPTQYIVGKKKLI